MRFSRYILTVIDSLPNGDGEIRTLDPLLARQVLSQLSYTPINSGIHLLSRAVSSKVPSAVYVLTIVFGMGTGVSHKRIDTTDCDHLASCFAARLVRTSLPARLVRSLTNLAAA